MDLAALHRVFARTDPEPTPPATTPAAGVPNPATAGSGDLSVFSVDELRRAAYPDEWAEIEGNPDALAQFARALRLSGDWERSCTLTAPEWAALAPEREPDPPRPATCRTCQFWRSDPINPAAGLGTCAAPMPERERLRRLPAPWPDQPGCPHGRPIPERTPDE